MKRPYQVASVVLIVFSAFVAQESLRMRYYTPLGPGPGFFPLWVSLLLGSMAAIMLFRVSFRAAGPMPDGFLPSREGYLRMGAILLALVATVVLLKPVGFRLTMLSFLLFLLFALGRQNLIITLLVALAGSFGVYHAFVEWLDVPLPTGMLGI